MLISVSFQHPAQKKSGIAAGLWLGRGRERASDKQTSPDEHWVGSRTVSRSYSQPLGMVSPGRENCQKQGQEGKVGKFWMISNIMGNGSICRVAVEQKSHLWLPVSRLYEGAQPVCSQGCAASPSSRAPGGLLAHVSFPCGHLVTAQQSTKSWGTEFCYGLVCIWL